MIGSAVPALCTTLTNAGEASSQIQHSIPTQPILGSILSFAVAQYVRSMSKIDL